MQLHFTASARPEAQAALVRLRHQYGDSGESKAEVIVALGGDGHMLDVLRRRFDDSRPVYGMNRGTIGFLLNEFNEDDLIARIQAAKPVVTWPLEMVAEDILGTRKKRYAINEVSLLRETQQTAKLRILVDGKERMAELAADGVLLATPAGSTAYNYSAHGPILPLGSGLLALTPISAFRPRRWRGALLPHDSQVRVEVLDPQNRPVAVSADAQNVRDVCTVDIQVDNSLPLTLLFDEGRELAERILAEQFEG